MQQTSTIGWQTAFDIFVREVIKEVQAPNATVMTYMKCNTKVMITDYMAIKYAYKFDYCAVNAKLVEDHYACNLS